MQQANTVLPVYAGDVSGVCSALFELGGMVVIHDPSGCNSTYNTHDEIRWYDHDSLIYVSGLTDVDAIMGDDQKLVDEVVEAARQTHPRFVALVNSPVPYQLGTDFEAMARMVSERAGLPAFHVPTNGMHDYVRGAGLAFDALWKNVLAGMDVRGDGCTEQVSRADAATPSGGRTASISSSAGAGTASQPRRATVNVLGMTPLDFAAPGSRDALASWLESEGFEALSCWAMGSSLDDLARAPEADLNLVVSATGMRVARTLRQRCGTPYVVGVPVPGFAGELASAMRFSAEDRRDRVAYLEGACEVGASGGGALCANAPLANAALVGEPVCMGSVAAALRQDGVATRVVCPLEDSEGLLGADDLAVRGEEGVRDALAQANDVVADPFYAQVCPEGARMHGLAHLAFSGRQWLRQIPNLMRLDVARTIQEQ
ncbi:MAG: nitrogenase component 1 [Atopobiaceae bacterium]